MREKPNIPETPSHPHRPHDPADHQEWLIDESIEETFPASDPASPSHPYSIAPKYRARKDK